MSRVARFAALGLVLGTQGCNNVTKLGALDAHTPQPGRAIVVYGVGVEGSFGYPKFAVALDEYNMERKAITGGCLRYNHMNAAVAPDSQRVERVAFEVEPGYYVYSASNVQPLKDGPVAFEIPADTVVYLGDFIYKRGDIELRRNQPLERASLATTVRVPYPHFFVCTP